MPMLQRAVQHNVSSCIVTGTSIKASQAASQLVTQTQVQPLVSSCSCDECVRLTEWHCSSQSVRCSHCEAPADVHLAGIHPHDANQFDGEKSIAEMRDMIESSPQCVAVGECGLDYNRMFSSKEATALLAAISHTAACHHPHCRPIIVWLWYRSNLNALRHRWLHTLFACSSLQHIICWLIAALIGNPRCGTRQAFVRT